MTLLFGLLLPFLVYYVIVFVVSYVVVDYGQVYLYDEVTPGSGLKVASGAAILAAMLTWARTNFATMFTDQITSTVFLAILWAGVFILIYRFHPWHGFGLAMATMLIFAGMSTIAVESMLSPRPAGRMDVTKENKLIRRSTSSAPIAQPKAEAAPAK